MLGRDSVGLTRRMLKERVEHTGIQADKKIQLDSHLLIDVASMRGQFRQEDRRFKVYNLSEGNAIGGGSSENSGHSHVGSRTSIIA